MWDEGYIKQKMVKRKAHKQRRKDFKQALETNKKLIDGQRLQNIYYSISPGKLVAWADYRGQ